MKRMSTDCRITTEQQPTEQFYATIFHEIRTAVHGICGIAELLKESSFDNTQQEHVQTIEELGNDLNRLCVDVLNFQLTRSPQFQLIPFPCNLRQRIRRLVETTQPQASLRGATIAVDMDDFPDQVCCDGTRIVQVFHNLLQNAIAHSGGRLITLGIHATTDGAAHTVLHCSVEDTGMGIPSDLLDHVFRPMPPSADSQGAGLGLAICAQLVHQMGGAIAVNSFPGVGCRFEFSVRIANTAG